jgi:redox-sensitive bicupin YhaK (pirin superfamily)
MIQSIQPLGFPWQTQDPFLFCAYHKDHYPPGKEYMGIDPAELSGRNIGSDFVLKDDFRMYHGKTIPGFPYHPHRGFETITINLEGVVDHSDSMGAAGRFMGGDVQWMTAGRGVLHSEMFPLINSESSNPLEMMQIWLNLPSYSKMVDPHFKMLWSEDIPIIQHTDQNNLSTTIRLVAGTLGSTTALDPTPDSWAADASHAVSIYTVKMEAKAHWVMPRTVAEANRTLYYYNEADLKIGDQKIQSNHLVQLAADQDISIYNGDLPSELLVLEGVPINEPVVQHGPFVMNTQEEIQQTMRDYGRTQFGGWPWPETEYVHARDKGRFALHGDGREEIKEALQ